jgi:hypothetical protein
LVECITFEKKEEGKMEQGLPIEELAKQRLNVLVNAYSLFIKNLMDQGFDREKVKRASDKVWSMIGDRAGEQMKSIFGEAKNTDVAQQVGAIPYGVHGIEVKTEVKENEIRSECFKCPWRETYESIGLPKEWRFCSSGHVAFAERMFKALNPKISVKMTKSMPMGDSVCEIVTSL